ncbi:hypothetical protein [Brevundimonas sp.]|uniref:hypothetical protein n=1 Tax=Brevundimonas sp. TaxID=1871086 RepID=UPI0035668677
MSEIRPPVLSPLFPTQSPVPATRGSRSDFFRAPLQAVEAPGARAAEAEPTFAIAPATTPASERYQRPGALLDIRV